MKRYYVLDMSGYVLSVHKSVNAQIKSFEKHILKMKLRGITLETSADSFKKGDYFFANKKAA